MKRASVSVSLFTPFRSEPDLTLLVHVGDYSHGKPRLPEPGDEFEEKAYGGKISTVKEAKQIHNQRKAKERQKHKDRIKSVTHPSRVWS